MKTTLDIQGELLTRAKQYAQRTRQPLAAVIEEGLRQVLSAEASRRSYRLPDLSVGNPNGPDPLSALSWQEVREAMYGPKGS